MQFCERCGSFMEKTARGYECLRCGYELRPDVIEYRTGSDEEPEPVYVMTGGDDAVKVKQICPRCGFNEAYRQITVAIGEHAGVKSDRSVEKFRCAECGHTWVMG